MLVWIIFILSVAKILPESMGDFPATALLLFTLLWGVGGFGAYQYAEKHSPKKKTEAKEQRVPIPYAKKSAENSPQRTIPIAPKRMITLRYDPQVPADKAITPAIRLFLIAMVIWMISIVGLGNSPKKEEEFQTIALVFVAVFFVLLVWKTIVYLKYTKSIGRFGVSELRFEKQTGDYGGEDELSLIFINERLYHKISEVTASLNFIEENFVEGRYAPQISSEEFDVKTLYVDGKETRFTMAIPRDAFSDFDPQGSAYWEVEIKGGGDFFASFNLPLKRIM